jgi:arylsulfatase A-like enzyme/Flp pilus assembly protein TadD
MKKFRSLIIILVLALLASGLWLFFSGKKKPRNILLITLDTTRADHLGCYGFNKNTTPTIDGIAAEGMLFENAFSPIPLTLPAHCSMFTGTYPPYHKVHDNISFKLDPSNITLAETLSNKGIKTAAVISAYVLYPQFGIDQGFEYYNSTFINPIIAGKNRDTERRGGETTDFAIDYIQQNKDDPFFLFLHYYDPHMLYDPPEPFASKFAKDPYAGEIAYTDYCISRVVRKLKELDLYDSTLIIIAGDHGEGLGDHGETEHGFYVYQSTIDIPFIIKPPHLEEPKRIEDPVSLVDVMPTILSYLGIDIPKYIQGKDLSVYAENKPPSDPERKVFSESLIPTKYQCNPLLAVSGSNYKYIKTTRPELYDLAADPNELKNIVDDDYKRARFMEGFLQDFILGSSSEFSADMELDDESIRKLESLGYVGGDDISDSFELDITKRDPKNINAYYEHVQEVTNLKYRGKFAEAGIVCYEMLEKWPQILNTHILLTQVTFSQQKYRDVIKHGKNYMRIVEGQIDRSEKAEGLSPTKHLALVHRLIGDSALELNILEMAIENFEKALEIKSNWPEVHYTLGAAYYKKGQIDLAIAQWREALQLKPDWKEVRQNLDKLLAVKEREQTIEKYEQLIKDDPDDAIARDELAKLLYVSGKTDEAITHWAYLVKLKPDSFDALSQLANAHYKKGNSKAALKFWSKAIVIKPDSFQVRNNLAWILAADKDTSIRNPNAAIEHGQKACQLTDYRQPGILDTLSVAYAAAGRFDEAIATAQKALVLARAAKQDAVALDIQKHLDLYRKEIPYTD